MEERELMTSEGIARSIRHHLDSLKFQSTGRDPKNAGFAYAEVPEWQLRRWLEAVELDVLTCDVRLPPVTTIRKGCNVSTLMTAIRQRATYEDKDLAFRDIKPVVDEETVQALLDLLNPLHGSLDRMTFDEKVREEFNAPRDHEYDVTVTAGQESDLTQAVKILEDRKAQFPKPLADALVAGLKACGVDE